MCGIFGYTALHRADNIKNLLAHRGPDGSNFFSDDFISLFHWRLSIIDLSDLGQQPFYFNQYVLVYNGEIFNYKEIRKALQQHGYTFSTESDTEVIIKAFDFWQEDCVKHFRGMFAFAVYDKVKRDIFLFRDRMGVKPLYYSLENGLSFGSEMKVFKKLNTSADIDPISLHQYFRWGYSAGERSIFKKIFKLKPGCFLKYSNNIGVVRSYWSIPLPKEIEIESETECVEGLEKVLIESFQYRMVSDVPVGIFLSGGIDSSLLATLLQKSNPNKINTFTIGFDDKSFNEAPYAKIIAERLNTNHHELILDVSKVKNLFRDFYSIYDEPFSDTSGIPTALVASLARQQGVKVVLSADGADEFFGGYPHYTNATQSILHWLQFLPLVIREGIGSISRFIVPHERRSLLLKYNFEHRSEMTDELLQAVNSIAFFESKVSNQALKEIEALTGFSYDVQPLLTFRKPVNTIASMMYWDGSYYLPDDLLVKVDRATMYYGVEAREPFLDHHIIEFAQRLPLRMKIRNGVTKYILRRILYQYHPEKLFNRPKQGFSIPIFNWFSRELDNLFEEYLEPNRVNSTGILNSHVVSMEKKKYHLYKAKGKDYNIEKMWRILSFMMWHEKWMN
jgi:asparagine synthase (glutamine-hydrolysing)